MFEEFIHNIIRPYRDTYPAEELGSVEAAYAGDNIAYTIYRLETQNVRGQKIKFSHCKSNQLQG